MISYSKLYYIIICMSVLMSCENDMKDIIDMTANLDANMEMSRDIELLYSDSAIIKVKVTSPVLIREKTNKGLEEIFPDGLHVEFYDKKGRVNSYMDASLARRNEQKGQIVAEDSVVVYNRDGDKLETTQLIWSEQDQTLENNRFVRITRPKGKDTLYGFGIITDQDFKRFEIKEVLGKSRFNKLTEGLR